MSIKAKVIDIIVETLGVDKEEVTFEKSFIEDLNVDSLDFTDMVMRFEEKFECDIPEEEAEKLKTVGDAINYMEKSSVQK